MALMETENMINFFDGRGGIDHPWNLGSFRRATVWTRRHCNLDKPSVKILCPSSHAQRKLAVWLPVNVGGNIIHFRFPVYHGMESSGVSERCRRKLLHLGHALELPFFTVSVQFSFRVESAHCDFCVW